MSYLPDVKEVEDHKTEFKEEFKELTKVSRMVVKDEQYEADPNQDKLDAMTKKHAEPDDKEKTPQQIKAKAGQTGMKKQTVLRQSDQAD